MSLELAALSFFKSKKIDYYYDKPLIRFTCVNCQKEAVMHALTTNWSCSACDSYGTLAKLINNENFKTDVKVYNPKKEKKEVLNLLNRLKEQYDDEYFIKLEEKLLNLLSFYTSVA